MVVNGGVVELCPRVAVMRKLGVGRHFVRIAVIVTFVSEVSLPFVMMLFPN